MNDAVQKYITSLPPEFTDLADMLFTEIQKGLPEAENKVWHGHPVWFLEGNPIVGFSLEKRGLRLMFWSGADFEEPALLSGTGKFKDASIFYQPSDAIDVVKLQEWLEKSKNVQWDYKNIVKNKGELHKLTV